MCGDWGGGWRGGVGGWGDCTRQSWVGQCLRSKDERRQMSSGCKTQVAQSNSLRGRNGGRDRRGRNGESCLQERRELQGNWPRGGPAQQSGTGESILHTHATWERESCSVSTPMKAR